jgi:hypothetical protein
LRCSDAAKHVQGVQGYRPVPGGKKKLERFLSPLLPSKNTDLLVDVIAMVQYQQKKAENMA